MSRGLASVARRKFRRWSGLSKSKWATHYLTHSAKAITRQPTLKPVITQELVVIHDDGEFRALWKKIYGVWSCAEADIRLRWMIGQTQAEVHLILVKMGVNYRWDKPAVRTSVRTVAEASPVTSGNNTNTVQAQRLTSAPSPVRCGARPN